METPIATNKQHENISCDSGSTSIKTSDELFRLKQSEMSDSELSEAFQIGLSQLCKTGGKSLTMHVPPRINDFDMLASELINRFKRLTAAQ